MGKEELKEELESTKENLLNIKKMYRTSVFSYLNYGNHITSKLIKDNGLHLVSLSNEMFKLEEKISQCTSEYTRYLEEITL